MYRLCQKVDCTAFNFDLNSLPKFKDDDIIVIATIIDDDNHQASTNFWFVEPEDKTKQKKNFFG